MGKRRILLFVVVSCVLIVIGAVFYFGHGDRKDTAKGPTPSSVRAVGKTASLVTDQNLYEPPVETEEYKKFFIAGDAVYLTNYDVRAGDSLAVIAKKNSISIDLLKKVNGLSGNNLQPGQKLKIPKCRFSVVVDKSRNILMLKANEDVLKIYTISTGRKNSTPVGVFKITDKIVNPTWYTDGKVIPYGNPENVLGTRWMGFNIKGYGIHGTTQPEKLGQQVTDGCVRMKNAEVEELFGLISKDTEVTIVD